jgi:hypothetical protein
MAVQDGAHLRHASVYCTAIIAVGMAEPTQRTSWICAGCAAVTVGRPVGEATMQKLTFIAQVDDLT